MSAPTGAVGYTRGSSDSAIGVPEQRHIVKWVVTKNMLVGYIKCGTIQEPWVLPAPLGCQKSFLVLYRHAFVLDLIIIWNNLSSMIWDLRITLLTLASCHSFSYSSSCPTWYLPLLWCLASFLSSQFISFRFHCHSLPLKQADSAGLSSFYYFLSSSELSGQSDLE